MNLMGLRLVILPLLILFYELVVAQNSDRRSVRLVDPVCWKGVRCASTPNNGASVMNPFGLVKEMKSESLLL